MKKSDKFVVIETVAPGRASCIFRHLAWKKVPTTLHPAVEEGHRVYQVRVLVNDVARG